VTCPRCGALAPADARFCASCGLELASASAEREERKVVSILFIDLVGSTSRADGADPEDVRDALELYFGCVRAEVERYGGTIEKFIGDAVMAVFGAPKAGTDDAERAVRAGLDALEAVARLDRERPELGLAARAAVNTGEAMVSIGYGHERGEALALGDVVNTASRLQTAAPPGGLVVGEQTYRATRSAIRYEGVPDLRVKGKRDALSAWLALEPFGDAVEPAIRTTPLLGRDRELALLAWSWDGANTQQRPHLVSILGPPGIGKSRLSKQFGTDVLRGGGLVIRGRSLPYETREPYAAFAHQLRQMAGIFEQDPPSVARAKVGTLVDGLAPEAERAEITRSLSLMLGLGLDEPVNDALLLRYSARRLVEELARRQPTLLVFEDVHWAGEEELELIRYLAVHVRDAPVVLLAIARPELLDTHGGWANGVLAHTSIPLDPLASTDAAAIVTHLVGEELSENALTRLVDAAEGNPLFLEELTSALLEGAGLDGPLPSSVRTVIAARVDALPEPARAALLAAAVVGKVFWRGTLDALGATDLDEALSALEARDLIRRSTESQVEGDAEFVFKHILIRDVCYATLPRAERRRAHEAVARHIERLTADDRELAWLLANHWEAAGDAGRAVDYLLLAAERAQEMLALQQAMDLSDRAYALAEDDATRTRVSLQRGRARISLGDHEAGAAEVEAVLPSLDGRDRALALLCLARAYHWTERTDETRVAAEGAAEAARDAGADDVVAPAYARLSQALAMRGEEGDLQRAIELGEEALAGWHAGAFVQDLAEHQHLLADQHYWMGRYARALELADSAKAVAVDPLSTESRLRGGGMRGLVLAAMGNYEEAITSADAAIAAGLELGHAEVRVLLNYSTAPLREVFALDEARARSERAVAASSPTEAFHMPRMNALADLIETDILAGELGVALTRWEPLWEEALGTPAWERWLLGGKLAAFRAELALAVGEPQEAATWAERAARIAAETSRAKYAGVADAILARSLARLRESDAAVERARAAVTTADQLGNPSGRWRAYRALSEAARAAGDGETAERASDDARGVIRAIANGLSPDRAAAFLAAPQVGEALAD
jgi:class 3 adenylate cyclase